MARPAFRCWGRRAPTGTGWSPRPEGRTRRAPPQATGAWGGAGGDRGGGGGRGGVGVWGLLGDNPAAAGPEGRAPLFDAGDAARLGDPAARPGGRAGPGGRRAGHGGAAGG